MELIIVYNTVVVKDVVKISVIILLKVELIIVYNTVVVKDVLTALIGPIRDVDQFSMIGIVLLVLNKYFH